MGVKLPETTYATDCRLYAPDHPDGPFAPFVEKLDRFILAHFLGWICKALMFRDWFILMASVGSGGQGGRRGVEREGGDWDTHRALTARGIPLQVCSVGFEFIEYTFEYQLPNFGECWWDHVSAAALGLPRWQTVPSWTLRQTTDPQLYPPPFAAVDPRLCRVQLWWRIHWDEDFALARDARVPLAKHPEHLQRHVRVPSEP